MRDKRVFNYLKLFKSEIDQLDPWYVGIKYESWRGICACACKLPWMLYSMTQNMWENYVVVIMAYIFYKIFTPFCLANDILIYVIIKMCAFFLLPIVHGVIHTCFSLQMIILMKNLGNRGNLVKQNFILWNLVILQPPRWIYF